MKLLSASRLQATLLLLFLSVAARAQDPEGWVGVHYRVLEKDRFSWAVSSNLRFQDSDNVLYHRLYFNQGSYRLNDRVTVFAAHMFRTLFDEQDGKLRSNRLSGGLFYRPEDLPLTFKGTYERYLAGDVRPSLDRYRAAVETPSHGRPIEPWLYEDIMFLNSGFARSRSRVGARVRWQDYAFKVGYQFESRRTDHAWAPHHAFIIDVTLNRLLHPKPSD